MKPKVIEAEFELDKKDKIKDNMLYVRASNIDLAILHQRSVTMNMPLSTYMMWRSLKPLGQLKKKKDEQDIGRLDYEIYLKIHKELNHQGVNLNQIARVMNSKELTGQSVVNCMEDIKAIGVAIEEISRSIAAVGRK